MLAILPFLIQWIALSQLGQDILYKQTSRPTSHWSLLHELQKLPEEEIDHFLPQVCSMMLDRATLADDDLFDYFESIVEQKCAECFSFGTKVCAVLKATQQPPAESLLKSILVSTATSQRDEERLRAFNERAEYATAYGYNLPPELSEQRSIYYRDYQFLLDSLARLGTELKDYPVSQRNAHLRHALSQNNALLYYRMASRGSVSAMKVSIQDVFTFPELTAHNIAALCPGAAEYSLHLPLHQCNDRVMRILRFVESECEVLPSKERCPYLVTVEVLEQNFDCKSTLLYAQGMKGAPAVALARGAKLGQISYSSSSTGGGGQKRLSGGSSVSGTEAPNSSADRVSATFDESVPSDDQPARDEEQSPMMLSSSVVPTTTEVAYRRYTPARRRGSLLTDSLARTGTMGGSTTGEGFSRYRQATASTQPHQQRYAVEPASVSVADSADFGGADGEGAEGDDVHSVPSSSNEDESGQKTPASHQRVIDSVEIFTRAERLVDKVEREQATGEDFCLLENAAPTAAAFLSTHKLRGGEVSRPVQSESNAQDSRDRHPLLPTSRYRARRRAYSTAAVAPAFGGTAPAPRSSLPQHSSPQYAPGSSSYALSRASLKENTAPSAAVSAPRDGVSRHLTGNMGDSLHNNGDGNHFPGHPNTLIYKQASVQAAPPPLPPLSTQEHQQQQQHMQQMQPARRRYVRPKTAEERRAIVRAQSPFGHLPGWNMKSFIVKSGDDLRKEILAMQLMEFCKKVFELEGLDIFLRPYQIVSTGAQAGLVEYLDGAESVDKIKKTLPKGTCLKQYFELNFGESYSLFYAKAAKNFVRSLVGYSLLTYLVQVKDRHNANILIDGEGHVLHIDFGYILGDSPGFNINFESAPFKLTREYLDLLGGPNSEDFKLFQDLFLRGFLALQKHIDGITSIIQLFYGDKRRSAAEGVRSRLLFPQSQEDILSLIGDSVDNWRTKQYDWYQERTNNIQY